MKKYGIEALRILAAFGTVWYHCGASGHDVAYAGLIWFLMLAAYLRTTGKAEGHAGALARRLLLPWIVWFAIYAVPNAVQHKPIVSTPHGTVAGILTGSSSHLWYLPFAFFIFVTLDFAKRRLPMAAMAIIGAVSATLTLLCAPYWRQASIDLGYPVAQYAHALAAPLIGVFAGGISALPRSVALGLFIAIVLAASSTVPLAGVGVPYLVALAFGYIAWAGWLNSWASPRIETVSVCTFGVYLIHPAVARLVGKVVQLNAPAFALLVFVGSLAIIYGVRAAFPRSARLVT